jgi:hypothetical protein
MHHFSIVPAIEKMPRVNFSKPYIKSRSYKMPVGEQQWSSLRIFCGKLWERGPVLDVK